MSNLPILRNGATGDPVRRLQSLLVAARQSLPIDGNFGPTTEQHVRWFQVTKGLTNDGVVGPKTWAALLGV